MRYDHKQTPNFPKKKKKIKTGLRKRIAQNAKKCPKNQGY